MVGASACASLVFFSVQFDVEAAVNMVSNPGFETPSSNPNIPEHWIRGRWGTNTAVFSYPVTSSDGSRAARVALTAHTSGDAKWAFDAVPVVPGRVYSYSNTYTSDVPSYITLEYIFTNGTRDYIDIAQPTASPGGWSTFEGSFTVPSGVAQVRVFHLINRVGTLSIDNVELIDITPPEDDDNIIQNYSFETPSSNPNIPEHWIRGRWGTNTAVFSYPVTSSDGSRAARVALTAHTSGDAKWAFDAVPVSAGDTYEFSNRYTSDVTTYVTIQMRKNDGSISYMDIGVVPASVSWNTFSASFIVPLGVTSLSVFHVIKQVGVLTVDDYALRQVVTVDPNKFDKGYVSIHFDDGHRSMYENAIPILNAAGFTSDQFITTEYVLRNFPGYVTASQVIDMQNAGHVIGAHTYSHSDLTLLSQAEAEEEIGGSRDHLRALGAIPVDYFAYPFGAYNASVQAIVQSAGFLGARSSDGGYNDKTVDQYALRRQSVERGTTFTDVKGYIDTAQMEKTWLILLFHKVDNEGSSYAITPELFQQIVDYLDQINVEPITMKEGLMLMNK